HVLDGAKLAERNGKDGSAMMPESHRSQAERLYRTFVAATLDVFADAEGVVQHVEDAADDILDQRLRTEANGNAEDAGAGDQRRNLHAEPGEDGEYSNRRDESRQRVAEDRQQRAKSATARQLICGGA